jgi:hypothetical protein
MKKRLYVISLMIGLLCLFSSVGVVLADPVQANMTPIYITIAIGLGIMVLFVAIVGWFALRHLHQNRKKALA